MAKKEHTGKITNKHSRGLRPGVIQQTDKERNDE